MDLQCLCVWIGLLVCAYICWRENLYYRTEFVQVLLNHVGSGVRKMTLELMHLQQFDAQVIYKSHFILMNQNRWSIFIYFSLFLTYKLETSTGLALWVTWWPKLCVHMFMIMNPQSLWFDKAWTVPKDTVNTRQRRVTGKMISCWTKQRVFHQCRVALFWSYIWKVSGFLQ